ANELFHAALRPVCLLRYIVEDFLELVLGVFARLPAPAPAIHVSRNRILLVPATARILWEIDARICGAIEVAQLDAVLSSRLGQQRRSGHEQHTDNSERTHVLPRSEKAR